MYQSSNLQIYIMRPGKNIKKTVVKAVHERTKKNVFIECLCAFGELNVSVRLQIPFQLRMFENFASVRKDFII